jgi:WhiB family redox-sensing transcriptional regulator
MRIRVRCSRSAASRCGPATASARSHSADSGSSRAGSSSNADPAVTVRPAPARGANTAWELGWRPRFPLYRCPGKDGADGCSAQPPAGGYPSDRPHPGLGNCRAASADSRAVHRSGLVGPRPQACCADGTYDPEQWFPVSVQIEKARHEAAAAIAVCASCPVRAPCLALSLRHWDIGQHGVWGGLVAAERAALRRLVRVHMGRRAPHLLPTPGADPGAVAHANSERPITGPAGRARDCATAAAASPSARTSSPVTPPARSPEPAREPG